MATDIRRSMQIDPFVEDGIRIYNCGTVEFYPGMTVLLGCNGAGKTTLMRQVEATVKVENDLPTYWYDIRDADRRLGMDVQLGRPGSDALAYLTSKFLSEGEQIRSHFEMLAYRLGNFVFTSAKSGKGEAWIFFDSLDSGWSIDNCRDFVEFINDTVLASAPDGLTLYILMAVNSYEFAKVPEWRRLDVQTLGYLPEFESYEAYADYVMKTFETKKRIWA